MNSRSHSTHSILCAACGILALFLSVLPGCVGDAEPQELRQARRVVDDFMRARIQRNAVAAGVYLTPHARLEYGRGPLSLIAAANPSFARYEILDAEELDDDRVLVTVRIIQQYHGSTENERSFQELLTLIRQSDHSYKIGDVEAGELSGSSDS